MGVGGHQGQPEGARGGSRGPKPRKPKDDLNILLPQIISKVRALKLYAKALQRGLTLALTGKVKPNKMGKIIVRVKIKFSGEKWQRIPFEFDAKALGWPRP
jgi:hypothetical protein